MLKKLQILDDDIKEKMIKYFLQKLKFEHMVRVFEWVKHRDGRNGIEFKSEDEMQFLITIISHMNKFLFKGVDNAILDIEYKKNQKAIEKAHKIENKHGKETGDHGTNNKSSPSPPRNRGGRPETAKVGTKNKFSYVPLEKQWLEWKYPPGFRFTPEKREIQIMIKKQTILKSIEDIELNPMNILKG